MGSLLWYAGFECGTTGELSAVAGATTVTPQATRTGSYGLRCSAIGPATAYGQAATSLPNGIPSSGATLPGLVVGAAVRFGNLPAAECEHFLSWSNGTSCRASLGIDSNGRLQVYVNGWTSGYRQFTSQARVFTAGRWAYVVLQVTPTAVNVWVDGVKLVELTNLTIGSGRHARFGKVVNLNDNDLTVDIDDVLLADDPTINIALDESYKLPNYNWQVLPMTVNGDGSIQQWNEGSAALEEDFYTLIDDLPFDQADYIGESSSNQVAYFTLTRHPGFAPHAETPIVAVTAVLSCHVANALGTLSANFYCPSQMLHPTPGTLANANVVAVRMLLLASYIGETTWTPALLDEIQITLVTTIDYLTKVHGALASVLLAGGFAAPPNPPGTLLRPHHHHRSQAMNFLALPAMTGDGTDQPVTIPRGHTLLILADGDVQVRDRPKPVEGDDTDCLTIPSGTLLPIGPSLGQIVYLRATVGTAIQLALN